ncbi:MAG: alpha-glucan family phosphorylase [bacterium]
MPQNEFMVSIFSANRGASRRLPSQKTVAYFCAEYAISDALPIYSGGLGVLAGDLVQQAALAELPFTAIGLFYKKGYFHQHLEPDGQHESTTDINPDQVPLTLLQTHHGDTLLIEVPIQEKIVYAQVWRYPVGQNFLYLLDTDHWKNTAEDKQITDQLYSGGPDKRIQQELVLGIGGYRLLKALGISPDVYHMNEGHSAFLSLELIRENMAAGFAFERALSDARRKLVFTNHTLVPAGNDVFPYDLVGYYLGKYANESGITMERLMALGKLDEQPGTLSVTMLAMRVSQMSNAVSRLHAKKAVEMWPDFKLESVTNGVHLPVWVAPELQHLWDQAYPLWRHQASQAAPWKAISRIPDQTLWDTHLHLKSRMLDEVYARTGIRLEDDVLTVVWARRFASYKRPDLLFSDIERLKKLLFSSDKPIQVIIAGKSHPADGQGKQIIEHIDNLAQYDLKHRAVFVDDYSISLARFLVSGADIWLNTPIFGLEASGTSGMKASANGVLQCTVPDGWAYEVDWYGLGFSLPIDKAETAIYDLLEKKIIPLYYKRGKTGIPDAWVSMMKRTITIVSPRFSSARMLEDYQSKMYNKLS